MLKQCNQCRLVKPIEEFYKCGGKTKSECKECSKDYISRYYKKNKEKCDKQKVDWCNKNRKKYNKYMRVWRENNKERVNEISSRSYKKQKGIEEK